MMRMQLLLCLPCLHCFAMMILLLWRSALSQLKTKKAGGIGPELILFGSPVLQDRLLALMRRVWDEGKVVDAWRDAFP